MIRCFPLLCTGIFCIEMYMVHGIWYMENTDYVHKLKTPPARVISSYILQEMQNIHTG